MDQPSSKRLQRQRLCRLIRHWIKQNNPRLHPGALRRKARRLADRLLRGGEDRGQQLERRLRRRLLRLAIAGLCCTLPSVQAGQQVFYPPITGPANPLDGVDLGLQAYPTAVDLDGDGDVDLVAGDDAGRVHYFEKYGHLHGTRLYPTDR